MKKKMLLPVVICLVLLIVFIVLVLLKTGKNNVTTITLDINPSIEIKLEEDEVKEVKGLNEDGKKVLDTLDDDMNLEDTIKTIMNRTMELDYIIDDEAVVLLHVDGEVDIKELERYLGNPLVEKGKHLNLIIVDKITKEDKELAKKYDITPAKAHYINELAKERDIKVEDYVNRSVREIWETKNTGHTCDEGYELRGDFCFKEVAREDAKIGKICPKEYTEYNGKCYESKPVEETDNYVCPGDLELRGDKCIRTDTREAQPKSFSCTSGELKKRSETGLGGEGYTCIDTSKATHPVSPCELNDGTEWTRHNGKCYWHRVGVLSNGCPGKTKICDGRDHCSCWDDASSVLICKGARDGKQYSSRSEYCENSIKYSEPSVSEYTCESGFTLSGTKCVREEEEPAQHERVCPSGTTKIEGDRCIDTSKTTDLVDGYVCDKENTEVHGKECITYEIAEAKHG